MTSVSALLRPVRADEGDALWSLLEPSGTELVGMTSLPSSETQARALCEASATTLSELAAGVHEQDAQSTASVVFVLTTPGDPGTESLLGVTAVTFKYAVPNIAVQVVTSDDGLGLDMMSSSVPWTRTELNSSYVAAPARGRGYGPLLSRGRFMFLHQVQRQIPSTIASHLRGSFSPDGTAPFWSCFGDHVTDGWADSVEAEHALADDPSRLDALVGIRRPVTAEVLDSLGPVNAASLPAFRLLMREGLRPNGMYDPIDGGPTLVAERERTITGQHRVHGRATISTDIGLSSEALVSVTDVDSFRVVLDRVGLDEEGQVAMGHHTADALSVEPGTLLAAAPIGRA